MKNQLMGLLFLSLAVSLSSCGLNTDTSPLAFSEGKTGSNQITVKPIQVPVPETDAAFAAIQKDLVEVSCIKCHNATQTKHSNLTTKDSVLEHADDMLYRMTDAWATDDGKMPPRGDAVSPAVIKEFRDWKSDIKFANLQKNLFQVSCLKCHGATQTRHSNLSSKAVVIEKYDDIVYRMTKAFDENNEPMPPVGKGTQVSPELVKELQSWKESL